MVTGAGPRFRSSLGLVSAALVLVADQVSKYIIVEQVMRPPGALETPFASTRVINVLPVFDLQLSWNPGISFSLFNSGAQSTVAILLVVQIALSIALTWLLLRTPGRWMQLALGLILGGALGNILDRATIGAVIDFLLFHWEDWLFPTFNLADSAISVGAGMWLLDAIFARPHHAAQT